MQLTLENATVTLAELVPAGGFKAPTGGNAAQNASRFAELPAFCRVAATLKPTADSDIKIEVWMPASGWNGKFEAVGNGGWAGTISYPAMAQALARGYATTSTDTGHSTPGGSFALGHPEKLIDYAYRSEHEMTVKAKAIINAFYGSAPTRSYFNGCSTGGRQALTEASRFPDDFDGIIAGAAANPKTHLDTWRIWMGLETLKDPATRIPKEKYPAIHQAVLAACDAPRRVEGRADFGSDQLSFRSAGDGVQGRRRTGLPDPEAGAIGEDDPGPGEEPEHGRGDLSRLSAGHRAGVGSA